MVVKFLTGRAVPRKYHLASMVLELKKLKLLSIQSNRITEIEGLEELTLLEELYLSHNGIKCIGGLAELVS